MATKKTQTEKKGRPSERLAGRVEQAESVGFAATGATRIPAGDLVEGRTPGGLRSALLFADGSVEAVVEVVVPPSSWLSDVAAHSSEFYEFWGRMVATIGSHDASPAISTDDRGATSIIVTGHRCGDADDDVRSALDNALLAAGSLRDALAGTIDETFERLADRAVHQVGSFEQSDDEGTPALAPTLDPARRRQLEEVSRQLRKQ